MKKNSPVKKTPTNELNTRNTKRQNKDDLDSRTGEEQIIKGDNITHNKKDTKSESKK